MIATVHFEYSLAAFPLPGIAKQKLAVKTSTAAIARNSTKPSTFHPASPVPRTAAMIAKRIERRAKTTSATPTTRGGTIAAIRIPATAPE